MCDSACVTTGTCPRTPPTPCSYPSNTQNAITVAMPGSLGGYYHPVGAVHLRVWVVRLSRAHVAAQHIAPQLPSAVKATVKH
jgi:hypothetical protein